MKNSLRDLLVFIGLFMIVIMANLLSQYRYTRIDLTEDQRFSLSETTLKQIQKVEDPLLITFYLDGDLDVHFQRLKEETIRVIEELQSLNSNIKLVVVNPSSDPDPQVRKDTYQQLQNAGIETFKWNIEEQDGMREQTLFPGALISYQDKEWAVNLIPTNTVSNPEQLIDQAISKLEFSFTQALYRLTLGERKRIAILEGHDELNAQQTASIEAELSKDYEVKRVDLFVQRGPENQPEYDLQKQLQRLNTFDLVVLAKPMQSFKNTELWMLDQYLMNNGRAIFMIDAVHAEMQPEYLANPIIRPLRLHLLLQKYGVRLRTELIQDLVCAKVMDLNGTSRDWVYFPKLIPKSQHPIVKNISAVRMDFTTSIDTLKYIKGVRKTPLLQSSNHTRLQATPGTIKTEAFYDNPDESQFYQGPFFTAILLEGAFQSSFLGEELPIGIPPLIEKASDAKLLVIADGDFIRNDVNRTDPRLFNTPLPVGYDQFTKEQYENGNLFLNAVEYMLDGEGLSALRGKEIIIRPLDMQRINERREGWEYGNLIAPIALTLLLGISYRSFRKWKYGIPAA